MRAELRTNSRGFLGRKYAALASTLPESFPDIDVLRSYVTPITSETEGRKVRPFAWAEEHSLAKVAAMCERYFEWGLMETIVKRFRTVMWQGSVLRILRRAALDLDEGIENPGPVMSKEKPMSFDKDHSPKTPTKHKGAAPPHVTGTPSTMITKYFSTLGIDSPKKRGNDTKPLIVKIHSKRQHVSTDELLEYRLEIDPRQLIELTRSGVQGIRHPEDGDEEPLDEDGWSDDDDGDGGKKGKKAAKSTDPESHLRIWVPATLVRMVEKDLVERFDELEEKKALRKGKKGVTTTVKPRAAPQKKPRGSSSDEGEKIDLDTVELTEEEDSDGNRIPIPPPSRKALKKPTASRTASAPKPKSLTSTKIPSKPPSRKSKSAPVVPKVSSAASASRSQQKFPLDDETDSNIENPFDMSSTSSTRPQSQAAYALSPVPPQRPKPKPKSTATIIKSTSRPKQIESHTPDLGESSSPPQSDSMRFTDAINKSPKAQRVSKKQGSPRQRAKPQAPPWLDDVSEEDEDEGGRSARPVSPSPMQPPRKASLPAGNSGLRPLPSLIKRVPLPPINGTTIIDISSDSDVPPAPRKESRSKPVSSTKAGSKAKSIPPLFRRVQTNPDPVLASLDKSLSDLDSDLGISTQSVKPLLKPKSRVAERPPLSKRAANTPVDTVIDLTSP